MTRRHRAWGKLGQSELIGALIMIAAVLAIGMALLSLYTSTTSAERSAANREVFLARESSTTLLLGKIDVTPSDKIIILSRKITPANLYILVIGTYNLNYGFKYLVPGVDYELQVANTSSDIVYFNLTANNITQWIVPTTIAVSSDYIYVQDLRIGETNYGALTNKISERQFITLYKVEVYPQESIMIRIKLLNSPVVLGIDTLWIKVLVEYNGRYYQIAETFFPLS